MDSYNITFKGGQDEQAITFHHLSTDKELADHEIIDRLFREMTIQQIRAEVGWLIWKYVK